MMSHVKKFFSAFLILHFVASFVQAQPKLIGAIRHGGIQFGTIVKYQGGDTAFSDIYKLTGNPGVGPSKALCLVPGNKLYGVVSAGGYNENGFIFEQDLNTNTFSIKYQFDRSMGYRQEGALMLASNGKLYGLTQWGGLNNRGVIYEFDYVTGIYTKKIDMDYQNGWYGQCTLVETSNGKMYGMTTYGGSGNNGVIFEYDFQTNTYTKKIDFVGPIIRPIGSLVEASNGLLYGTTEYGGNNDFGTIFEYNMTTNSYVKKFDMDSVIGSYPTGTLIEASNGKLYGMTRAGGVNNMGVLFEYDYVSNTYVKKFDFNGTDGYLPEGYLMQASNGKLYGTTKHGGQYDMGVIFEFDPTANTYNKIFEYAPGTGNTPHSGLIQLPNGKLYGTTREGTLSSGNLSYSMSSGGSVFEFNYTSGVYKILHDFSINQGYIPNEGQLLCASNGKIYGVTAEGGAKSLGTLYEFNYAGMTYTKKIDFDSSNGAHPIGSLIQASNNKIYGFTRHGGTHNKGTIYEYNYTTNVLIKLIDFDGLNGDLPTGSLYEAANGLLYGVTETGGIYDEGILYEYDIASNTLTKIFDFTGNPDERLIEAAPGKLYGMTYSGGLNNAGVIFEYDYIADTFSTIYDFDISTGAAPNGFLTQVGTNKLISTTLGGGAFNQGTIFEYDISTDTYTKKIDLDSANGCRPTASLFEASNGKFYGMTTTGGAHNSGVVFEYDYNSNTYTKKIDLLDSLTGFDPMEDFSEIHCIAPFIQANGPTSFCAGGSVLLSCITSGSSYQWFRNGIVISGATGSTYLATTPGKYSISTSDSNCTGTLSSNQLRVRIPCFPPQDPIERISLQNNDQVTVFYEPIDKSININGQELTGSGYRIEIMDNSGRVILWRTGKLINGFLAEQLDVSTFSTGIYIVRIHNNNYQKSHKLAVTN